MRYFKLDLLTLLVSLFTFSACQNSEIIGIDTGDANKISATQTDTVTVTATTVPEDLFGSSNLIQHALGYSQSPVFGKTEAGLALSVIFPADSNVINLGPEPKIDSAILVLKFGTEYYRDTVSTGSWTFNVNQLTEPIENVKVVRNTYLNDKSWGIKPIIAGSKQVNKIAIKDSISYTVIRPGKADTVQKVGGQLRLPIDTSLIVADLMSPIQVSAITRNNIAAEFKGFYVSVDKSKNTGNGGIVFFAPPNVNINSKLELYYTRSVGTKKVKSVIYFPIGNAVSSVKHDYSGSAVEESINKVNAKTVYLKALGGLRTKLNFPHLNQLKKLGNISVNKAQLILPVDPAVQNPFGNAPRLVFYTTDIAGQRQEILDNDWGQISGVQRTATQYGGLFDATKKTYTFSVTGFIQSVITGRTNLYDSYIAPININLAPRPRAATGGGGLAELDTRIIDAYPSGTTASHVALGGGTQSSSPVSIKLVITYTKLSQ